MILNSMLQNSPVAAVLMPLIGLAAYGTARAACALSRWLRTPRRLRR